MKQKRKSVRGITLIALVVTIVVLLILAAVSISMLTGENGIIKQAVESKDKNRKGEIEEKVKLAAQAALTDSLGQGIEQNKFQEELDTNFGSGVASLDYDETNQIYTVTVEDYEVEVSNKGSVGEATKSNISIKLTLSHTEQVPTVCGNVAEIRDGNVPIPTGFSYVEGTRDTGLVIEDDDGNEFVWVSVNQNQKLTLDVTSKEDITGIKVTYPDGTETTLIASGKTFNQEITMTKNGMYIVEVSTATTTKIASKRIMSLYAQDIEMNVINDLYRLKNDPNESYNSINELLVAKSYGTIEELLAGEGYNTIVQYAWNYDIYVPELEEEYKKYDRTCYKDYTDNNQNQESVNQYGGFYIARYEAGDGTTTSVRTGSSADTNTLVCKKGAYVYNHIDMDSARTLSSGMYSSNTAVTSQLITGAGWDRTLNWIIETGSKTENEVIIDSRSWGNYNNSTGNAEQYSGSSNMNYKTGRNEYWKANNIYDLAGNEVEWTQEEIGPFGIFRGGDEYNIHGGDIFPACRRLLSEPVYVGSIYISFRVQLYINI